MRSFIIHARRRSANERRRCAQPGLRLAEEKRWRAKRSWQSPGRGRYDGILLQDSQKCIHACRQAGRQAGREAGPDRRSEGLRLRVLEPVGVLPSLHGQDGDLIGVVVRVRVRGGGVCGQGKGGGGGGGW